MALLSVVVTIMDRGEYLGRCLEALSRQIHAPEMEIIVPVFPPIDDSAAVRKKWPRVRFVEIPDIPPVDPRGFSHWMIDRRRAVGAATARGEAIAMTDEFAIPNEQWCAMLFGRIHAGDADAIGGAIRPAGRSKLNRATFYCDFERFMPPFESGEYGFASLVNAVYTRPALEKCCNAWRDLFDETVVNERIRWGGGRIRLDSSIAVDYDPGRRNLTSVLAAKYESGRTYAGRRAASLPGVRRMIYAAGSFLLPFVLFARKLGGAMRRNDLAAFRAASPLLFLILIAWSAGEFSGYVTGRPFPRRIPARGARAAA